MKLPCIKADNRAGDDSDYVMIDIEDIYYIDLRRQKSDTKIMFHTKKGGYIFRFTGSLEACESLFEPYGFMRLDAVNVVNTNKIKFIGKNSYSFVAYFDDDIFTSIARSALSKVKHIPKKSIPD